MSLFLGQMGMSWQAVFQYKLATLLKYNDTYNSISYIQYVNCPHV